jgi:hypothetical protein
VGYPNEAERRRLERFPDRIAVEDLRACFALSDADRQLVFAQRGAANRLGLAVALCAVRFFGFMPADLASVPEEALVFVAGQVDAAEHELLAYGARAQTRSDHLSLLLAHLGQRRPTDADRAGLARWLGERAVEHDAAAALMALAGEHLRARRVLRPPVDALARLIATARGDAHREVERLLADQLPATRRDALDALLDGGGDRSELAELRRRAGHTGVRELLAQADRYRRLLALGADRIEVDVLPPARRRALESLGWRMTAQQLRRLEPTRRHPLLLVLLRALVIERGDELLNQFDKLLRLARRRAQRRVDEQRRRTARQRDELASLGRRLSRILLECAATGEVPLSRIEREVGLERLQAAAALDEGALPPLDQQELDVLRGAYTHLRPAVHAVLSAVELRAATDTDHGLLDALTRVRDQHARYVDESVELLPKSWRAWVLDEHGRVQRTRYELGLWYAARDALRAGRVFRPIGRRSADPAAFLLPAERWQRERRELAVTFDRPLAADERLSQLEAEQRAALRQLQAAVNGGDRCDWPAIASRSGRMTRCPRTPPLRGCRPTWSGCARTWRSPTCSLTSTPGRASAASSPTPPAPPRASATCASTCTRRCWPGA